MFLFNVFSGYLRATKSYKKLIMILKINW